MTGPAPSCFTQDNSRAEGLTGAQIYALMTGGPGTSSAQHAATVAGNPINQAMIQMQDALRQADHSLSNQVYQFNLNKGQLKNMPASKPETDFWDDATPWDTGTEDAVNAYNGDESHNRKVYSEFRSASNTNRGELPKEFPGVTADTLNVEIADTGGDDGRDKTGNDVGSSGVPRGTPNLPTSTGSPQGTTGSTWTPPGTINGDQTSTTTISAVGEGQTGAGRGPGGGAAGGKFGGGSGRLGGGGLSGVGTATGSGTSAQQPGGKSGVFGGMGETSNAAGRGGAAGAAGRAGAAGAGGMGGHGQKGQGEDDLEHKSADYLITEENTNEIIGDMPMVAPPTIGG